MLSRLHRVWLAVRAAWSEAPDAAEPDLHELKIQTIAAGLEERGFRGNARGAAEAFIEAKTKPSVNTESQRTNEELGRLDRRIDDLLQIFFNLQDWVWRIQDRVSAIDPPEPRRAPPWPHATPVKKKEDPHVQ